MTSPTKKHKTQNIKKKFNPNYK